MPVNIIHYRKLHIPHIQAQRNEEIETKYKNAFITVMQSIQTHIQISECSFAITNIWNQYTFKGNF